MTRAPDDGRYIERQVLDTTPEVQVDDEGRLSYSTSTPLTVEEGHRPYREQPLDTPCTDCGAEVDVVCEPGCGDVDVACRCWATSQHHHDGDQQTGGFCVHPGCGCPTDRPARR